MQLNIEVTCNILKLEYDYQNHAGKLTFANDRVVSMQGTSYLVMKDFFNLFSTIDADVREIKVVGSTFGVCYSREDEQWELSFLFDVLPYDSMRVAT